MPDNIKSVFSQVSGEHYAGLNGHSAERMRSLDTRAAEVMDHAAQHYQSMRNTFIDKEVAKINADRTTPSGMRDGPTSPIGMGRSNTQDTIRKQAITRVDLRYTQRIQRIESIQERQRSEIRSR